MQAIQLLQPGWELETSLPADLHLSRPEWGTLLPPGTDLASLQSIDVYTDGSFDGTNSSWAFVAFGARDCCLYLIGWAGARVDTQPDASLYIGAQAHTALVGEQSALFWALAWTLQTPPGVQARVHADCLVALRQATGQYGSALHEGLPGFCRQICQAVQTAHPSFDSDIKHVRSHKGHYGNDLVDLLAKYVNQIDGSVACAAQRTAPFTNLCATSRLRWLWVVLQATKNPGEWPSYVGTGFVDKARHTAPFQLAAIETQSLFGLSPDAPADTADPTFRADLCIFTLNVQTLAEAPPPGAVPSEDVFQGKAAFLREQFDHFGAHIIALQEARGAGDNTFVSSSHVRFCTGKDRQGNFGVELWFSRCRSFATASGVKVCFAPNDFVVLASTPRMLLVKYTRGPLRVLFAVIHAPSSTNSQCASWWRELRQTLHRFAHGVSLVMLGDFNAHFADSVTGHVGELVFPTKHPAPPALIDILQNFGLWLPSTFGHCHPGPTATWWPPSGGSGARLDYLAVPQSWGVLRDGSQVFSALEWGQARDDHHALRTWVHFQDRGRFRPQARRPVYDREAMLTDNGRDTLRRIFAAAPVVPWQCDVHSHYTRLQTYLSSALSSAFPATKGNCRSSHFSPHTWQLRQRRVWLRRQVVHLRACVNEMLLHCGWLTWQADMRMYVAQLTAVLRRGRQLITLSHHVSDLAATKKELRQAIRSDVNRRIGDAAATAAVQSTGHVVSRLQCLLGPSKRKTRQAKGLPRLQRADGTVAETADEVVDTWIEHFSGIEGGQRRTPHALAQACVKTQQNRDLDCINLTAADVPTCCELEAAFRGTQLHRAFGTDCIPAEALHAVPGHAARVLYSLILKCTMRIEEPLHWKGGSLYAVWKGKAAPHQCHAHRGILVSSVVGKAYHKMLRQRNVPALAGVATAFQIGGLPQRPVTMASHMVRAFQSWACGNGFSLGIIFLDLREAFYRIMRPLVVGFQGSDADIAAIVKEVHLPPEVMHEIHEYLQAETLFESAGASSWLSAATCEALSHTWFRFEHHEAVTETGIGTRPGDNLADIVFSFVFARVLHQVRTAVEQEVGIATLPWHSDMLANLWPVSSTATDSLAILDSTWMDDTALVLYTTVASELPHKIKRTLGILLDSCLGRALLPNLDRGKTETIVSLTGTGSRKLRAELFRDDPPLISADSRLWPGATVQIVPHYRHLGGLIHHSGALLRELRCRVAMAWQAFNKRRKRIFSSRFVPVADKVSLFDSLVLSTLLFGAGTWPTLTKAEEQCLSTAYFQMACTLLKPAFDSLQARRLGQLRVLALAGLPTISTLLHLARLRHLAACATNPIPELWALLHAEANWLASARHSLEWLCELVAEEGWAPSAPEAWHLWMDTIRCNPGRWKRLLRKAQQRAVRREAWHSAGVYHRGLLSKQLRIAGGILLEPVMELWDRRECCGPCRQTFPNLQAWSVHAFKTHGRLTAGRGVLSGRQCQKCLRHFATNLKLCKHLAYSHQCRRSLQVAGYHAPVEPGQGSTRGEDQHRVQAPVLQAEGPVLPFDSAEWCDEADRPVAEILDCLRHVGLGIAHDDVPAVEEQIRVAFASVCAPVRRLRITARAFLATQLLGLPEPIRPIVARTLEWVPTADVVEWLVPSPDPSIDPTCTFRDEALVLEALEVAAIRLPRALTFSEDPTTVLVGPDEWCLPFDDCRRILFPFSECVASLRQGDSLSFLEGPFEDVVFEICLNDWNGFRQCPPVCLPPASFHRQLLLMTLQGDLMRFALRLWGRGIPTRLLFPVSSRPHISLLLEIPGLDFVESSGWCTLSNCT
ncbi:unnamed protein product [Symbiodinium sp. CCMP2592]|nr:unnamed protein product [Symbiodinium sp. CCMP2592]